MKLETLRHSLAHILAYAVQEIYPELYPVKSRKAGAAEPQFNRVKFGIGPSIADGFYYDFDFVSPISADDLPKIEKNMRDFIKKDLAFTSLSSILSPFCL